MARIPRFCQKLKSPQNMLFFLQCDCFHDRTKFWMFQIELEGYFHYFKKYSKSTKKWPCTGKVRIHRFWSKLKSTQNIPCFSSKWLFSWKNKILKVSTRIGRVFSTFQKIQKINQRNGHAGMVQIQRFCRKLKNPQNMLFFLQSDYFHDTNKILNVSDRIGRVFSLFQKILKINQKMAMPVRSGYRDFAKNWKVPKTCFFFFKLIVFMIEQNFECFR